MENNLLGLKCLTILVSSNTWHEVPLTRSTSRKSVLEDFGISLLLTGLLTPFPNVIVTHYQLRLIRRLLSCTSSALKLKIEIGSFVV